MQLQLFLVVSSLSALVSAIPRPDSGNQGSLDVCSEESHYMKWPRIYFTVPKGKTCADALAGITKDTLVVAAPKDLCKTQSKDAEIRICSLSHNETKRVMTPDTSAPDADGCKRHWRKVEPNNVDLGKVEFKPENFRGQCFLCPDPNAKDSSEEEKGSSSSGLDNCKESRKFRWPKIYFTVPAGQTCDVANTKKPSDLTVGPPTDLCKNPAGGDNFRICSLSHKEIKRIHHMSANTTGANTSGANQSGAANPSSGSANPSSGGAASPSSGGANQSGESSDKCKHKMMDYTKIDLTQVNFQADNFHGKCFICPKTN